MSYIAKCDKCGATEIVAGHGTMVVPDKWKQTSIQVTTRSEIKYQNLHFCPTCSHILGLLEEPTEETAADKLMSIIEAVVRVAVDERGD